MRRHFLTGAAPSLALLPLIACTHDRDALVGPTEPGEVRLPNPLIRDGLLVRHRRLDAGGIGDFV